MQRCRIGTVVGGGDPDHDVGRAGFGVGDLDVEEPVVIQCAGVQQLELRLSAVPFLVDLHQLLVRERRLWVPVQPSRVGVGGGGVHVPPVLFDVLPVVALRVGQPEQPLYARTWAWSNGNDRHASPSAL